MWEDIKGTRISTEVLIFLLSLELAPLSLYHRQKKNTREERQVAIMAVLADGWNGRVETIKKQDIHGFLCLFLVEVNYTYGPIDVPICEGDELALI